MARRKEDVSDDRLTDQQIGQRRDDALRKALNTAPKQHKDMKKGSAKRQDDRPTASDEKRD